MALVQAPPATPKVLPAFERTPKEIFVLIYASLEDRQTGTFAGVCKAWREIAQDSITISHQIEQRYGKNERLFQALRRGPALCTLTLINLLLKSSFVPRQLAVALDRKYRGRITGGIYGGTFSSLPNKWGSSERVRAEVFRALASRTAQDPLLDFSRNGLVIFDLFKHSS